MFAQVFYSDYSNFLNKICPAYSAITCPLPAHAHLHLQSDSKVTPHFEVLTSMIEMIPGLNLDTVFVPCCSVV